jgi:hypothetical protein
MNSAKRWLRRLRLHNDTHRYWVGHTIREGITHLFEGVVFSGEVLGARINLLS